MTSYGYIIMIKVNSCMILFSYEKFFWYMMTSSNGNISYVTGLCAGNSPVTGEFPSQRQVTRSFDVFFE